MVSCSMAVSVHANGRLDIEAVHTHYTSVLDVFEVIPYDHDCSVTFESQLH